MHTFKKLPITLPKKKMKIEISTITVNKVYQNIEVLVNHIFKTSKTIEIIFTIKRHKCNFGSSHHNLEKPIISWDYTL